MNTDIKFENCHVMFGDCLDQMKEIPNTSRKRLQTFYGVF